MLDETIMKIKFIILVLIATIITGYMPIWVHNYYSPSAEEGIVKKSLCGESSGPKDTIELTRNDVIIEVNMQCEHWLLCQ